MKLILTELDKYVASLCFYTPCSTELAVELITDIDTAEDDVRIISALTLSGLKDSYVRRVVELYRSTDSDVQKPSLERCREYNGESFRAAKFKALCGGGTDELRALYESLPEYEDAQKGMLSTEESLSELLVSRDVLNFIDEHTQKQKPDA